MKMLNIEKHNIASFYSNLFYLTPMLYIFIVGKNLLDYTLGVAFITLAAGSAYYHYYEKHKYSWPDWVGMFFVFSAINIWAASKSFEILQALSPLVLVSYVLVLTVLLLTTYYLRNYNSYLKNVGFFLIGALFLGTSAIGILYNATNVYLMILYHLLLAVAFFIRQEGEEYFKQKDESSLKRHDLLHSIWHYLTAIAFILYITNFLK